MGSNNGRGTTTPYRLNVRTAIAGFADLGRVRRAFVCQAYGLRRG